MTQTRKPNGLRSCVNHIDWEICTNFAGNRGGAGAASAGRRAAGRQGDKETGRQGDWETETWRLGDREIGPHGPGSFSRGSWRALIPSLCLRAFVSPKRERKRKQRIGKASRAQFAREHQLPARQSETIGRGVIFTRRSAGRSAGFRDRQRTCRGRLARFADDTLRVRARSRPGCRQAVCAADGGLNSRLYLRRSQSPARATTGPPYLQVSSVSMSPVSPVSLSPCLLVSLSPVPTHIAASPLTPPSASPTPAGSKKTSTRSP